MISKSTIYTTPIISRFLPKFAALLMKITGWRIEGQFPNHRKCVIIAAPHTSNMDFIHMMTFAFASRVKVYWFGKSNLFKGPFKWFFTWFGGIPVNRDMNTSLVDRSAELIARATDLIVAIPAEGTRFKREYWKSGFYYIAQKAKVPIVLCYADYSKKIYGFGPSLIPSGDIKADFDVLGKFYQKIKGKRPERFTLPKIKD